ncbi:MAG: hypothetical protein KKA79_01175 [Nanoarchaeota archaeon]|nr:hypothetical protein [Nanoarchaeota archaeon]MCG2717647.1 hypothetical protein [Nanoarchaeota archaeon]
MKIPKTFRPEKDSKKSFNDIIKKTKRYKAKRKKKALEQMLLGIEKFIDYRAEDEEKYQFAYSLAKTMDYTPEDLQTFYSVVVNYDAEMGFYLSALTNKLFTLYNDELVVRPITKFDSLCSYMSAGKLVIEGDVKDYFGYEMAGGEVVIEGNALDYFCEDMKGGKVTINGSVRNSAADDMKNGEIIIHGDACMELGGGMEGGSITVYGNINDIGMLKEGATLYIEGSYNKGDLCDVIEGTIYYKGKKVWPE